ncbi:heat-inducible transcriptional repressor HrcA [Ruminococcaceae bacterium OttesenSCG-928-D13]|nr:heat-inducible transcriptional repressor HrcA [Ruminococcaceae bacterium OttesenSCG-928-D13]
MDDRKQRIMMAIVSLYSAEGEPVGSNLLSRHFDMAVSSATLRNEMAALTRLGLLEQPHTSAGRVPTTKGYRYYVDNLLGDPTALPKTDREALDELFQKLDYDPEKMAQGAAKVLSDLLGYAVLTTTPRAKDISVAHFEVVQVGRHTAAVLAVTAAGGVLTRVAKVDFELEDSDTAAVASALNKHLRFVAEPDINTTLVRTLVDSLGAGGSRYWPLLSAALTLMSQAGTPNLYFEGMQYLLHWPELETNLRTLLELTANPERVEGMLHPRGDQTSIMFGDEFPEHQIPGLCIISRHYLAGGGQSGIIAVMGPARMRYREVIPKLEYFSTLLGKGMSGVGA